jgi:hypothetical protein
VNTNEKPQFAMPGPSLPQPNGFDNNGIDLRKEYQRISNRHGGSRGPIGFVMPKDLAFGQIEN